MFTGRGRQSERIGEGEDDCGSYSDDFDGTVELDAAGLTTATTMNPGCVSLAVSQHDAGSGPERKSVAPSVIEPATATRPKSLKKTFQSRPGSPNEARSHDKPQYMPPNIHMKLAQALKRVRQQQKECNRLRATISQLQHSGSNTEIENEKADLKRQLKDQKMEIKTLKSELRCEQAAHTEWQQVYADYPDRIKSLSNDMRLMKEKNTDLIIQHRDQERQIRKQHNRICSLQKQCTPHTTKRSTGRSELAIERENWSNTEKELRCQIIELKHTIQTEQRRYRRATTTMKNTRQHFECEVIRLGNLLKEKERKLATSNQKFGSLVRQSDLRPEARVVNTPRDDPTAAEGAPDIAQTLQVSMEQIKSAFLSDSGRDGDIYEDGRFHNSNASFVNEDDVNNNYEEDFHEDE